MLGFIAALGALTNLVSPLTEAERGVLQRWPLPAEYQSVVGNPFFLERVSVLDGAVNVDSQLASPHPGNLLGRQVPPKVGLSIDAFSGGDDRYRPIIRADLGKGGFVAEIPKIHYDVVEHFNRWGGPVILHPNEGMRGVGPFGGFLPGYGLGLRRYPDAMNHHVGPELPASSPHRNQQGYARNYGRPNAEKQPPSKQQGLLTDIAGLDLGGDGHALLSPQVGKRHSRLWALAPGIFGGAVLGIAGPCFLIWERRRLGVLLAASGLALCIFSGLWFARLLGL